MISISNINDAIPKNAISQRVQSGITLSYIEGWYVIDRLNQLFGFNRWDKHIIALNEVQCEVKKNERGEKWYVGYTATIRLVIDCDTKIVKEDCGFGQGIDSDLGRAHESAIKEAVTDALKRCAKDLGMSFGLELYSKGKAHTTTEETRPQEGLPDKVARWLKANIVSEDDSETSKKKASTDRKELWQAFTKIFGKDAESVLLGCDDLAQAEASVKVPS